MIGFYDYTVVATYLATIISLVGVFQAMEGQTLSAVFCLLLTGLLDTVDGRIARTKKNRTEQEKRFGIQIDSLNDVICFGVLPAVIAYDLCSQWGDVPTWFIVTLSFFALTGLIRLAYFNVMEEERQQATNEKRRHYLGVPITTSALMLPLLYLLCLLLPAARLAILTAGLVITGLSYITPLRIRKPDTVGIIIMAIIGAAELTGLILAGAGILR